MGNGKGNDNHDRRYNVWQGPISSRAIASRKNTGAHKRSSFETDIVITAHQTHTISDHCADPLFRGPDVASLLERKFCDMGTRSIHESCEEDSEDDNGKVCFDLKILALKKRGKIVGRGAKSYERVKRWGGA